MARPLAGWCHAGSELAVAAGKAGQGRGCGGHWTHAQPRYKYPRLPAAVFAVFTRPQPRPRGGSSPAGPGGGGDQATAQTFPSGQTGPAILLPPPAPFLGGREAVTPHSGLQGLPVRLRPGYPSWAFQSVGDRGDKGHGGGGAGQDTQQGERKGKVRGGQSPPEGGSSRERDGETK